MMFVFHSLHTIAIFSAYYITSLFFLLVETDLFCACVLLPALNPTLPPFKRERFPVCILLLLLSFAYKLNPYCACEADYANYANDPWLFFVLQINPRLPSMTRWEGGGGREGEKSSRCFIIV